MDTGSTFWFAMGLTLLAGLSTTVGSAFAIIYKEPGSRFMAFILGFTAGVMVLVSFSELLPQGVAAIGFTNAHIGFFIGIVVLFMVDMFFPHSYIMETPEGALNTPEGASNIQSQHNNKGAKLKKAAVLVAVGIAIHNFPEGMVTFAGALKDVDLGIALAVAISIHNIPEGIAVAVPIYAVTKSANKAFKWSFLSGISEPVGALLAAVVLMPFLSDATLGWALSIVAGFMVFISLDELLPVANSYMEEHVAIAGVIVGMLVMAVSLALLQ